MSCGRSLPREKIRQQTKYFSSAASDAHSEYSYAADIQWRKKRSGKKTDLSQRDTRQVKNKAWGDSRHLVLESSASSGAGTDSSPAGGDGADMVGAVVGVRSQGQVLGEPGRRIKQSLSGKASCFKLKSRGIRYWCVHSPRRGKFGVG